MRMIDPACGSGVFLLSAIRICGRQFSDIPIYEIAKKLRPNLYGVDLDEAALEIADVSLSIMCREQLVDSRITSLGRTLKIGNSLISLNGWDGLKNYEGYFEEPRSRNSFEWRSQFPEVLSGEERGFDALLMNPPYERLKPNFAEFMRERLLSGSRKVHSDGFERCKTRLKEDLCYYRNSGEYTLANRHTLDTYRLFIERSLKLVRQGGAIGFIVPSTVLGDLSAEKLRRTLLLENSVKTVNDFPEGNRLFANVTQSVSIIVLKRGGTTKKLRASFGLSTVNEARRNRGYGIEIDKIPDSMRKSMVVPRLAKEEWHVLRKLHTNPTLESIQWLSNRRGEFDLTLHKRFISTKGARLLRGSHIGRYALRAGRRTHNEFVDTASFHASIGSSTRIEDSRRPRIACQQVSNRNQRWRLKFAPVEPDLTLANSCNYVVLSKDSDPHLLNYLLGVLNSELMNWRFDISSTNNHVSNRELSGLPLPEFTESGALDIVQRIGEIARNCAHTGRDYDVELEALVFSLYGLETQSAKQILSGRGASDDEIASVLDVLQGLMNP
jgi:Alw26I/Eco31I/Esp3I family type II restriction m6 adenine DNA methyltransferase